MGRCNVLGCTNRPERKNEIITFHRFPKNEETKQKWLHVIPINIRSHTVVCSHHFKPDDFTISCSRMFLVPNAVPSIFPFGKKNEKDLPVTSAPATQNENPLFLENEPMDEMSQGSDHNLSIKSESISITSDGFQENLESDEEEEKGDEQVESGENVKNTKDNDNEQDEVDDVDDKYDDYKFDDDNDDVSDTTVSVSCSSSDVESFEEMPIPIPTTMATSADRTRITEPAATADLTITTASGTIVLPSNTNKPSTTTTTPAVDHASPAYKQTQMLQRQRLRIETQTKKLKALKSQIRRKDKKLQELEEQMLLIKEYTKCSEIENILRGNYRKLCTAINKNGVPVNYSNDVIKFAITLNYYSPKAYEFIRKYMSLPNTRMLEKYAATGTYIIDLDD